MSLYVVGPVTGREDLNRKAFEDAREKLERAVYHQIAALAVIGTGMLTESTCDYPKEVVSRTLGTASDCLRASKACFESAGKESQDDREA